MAQLLQFYKSFQQNKAPAATSAPTFDDLSIDQRLTDLQRLTKYAKSTIALQRVVHVRMLADTAKKCTLEQIISDIVPLIKIFSNDVEPIIRHNFVDQLALLSTICVERGAQGYDATKLELLPAAVLLLEDPKEDVQKSALNCVAHMAQLIRRDDIGEHLLTLLLRLAHDDEKVEMRVAASELLNLVAEYLGNDLCKQFVFPEILSLAEDGDFRVRKSVALNFCNICKMGTDHEINEKLIPVFVTLSQDEMFRVRKACADSLIATSKFVNDEIRLGVLLPIFKSLAQDQSKFVKESVYKSSGMFISSLPAMYVNASILSHYISCLSEPIGDSIIDTEIKIQAAYSFPGVLLTLGKDRWKELKGVYHSLAQSRLPSIRHTIAASLHEVAKILGADNDEALVESELVPVFEDMIQDSEELQMGVVKNLAVFLKCLSIPIRLSYLPMIHDIVDVTKYRWRLRQVLCTQLADLIDLCPKAEVYTNLFPLVMELLQDTIVSVRTSAFKGVSKLILVLAELADSKDGTSINEKALREFNEVLQAVNSFVGGKKYILRQLWVQLCKQLLKDLPRHLFEAHFIDGILVLVSDRVSNVRIAVSQLLSGWDEDIAPFTVDPSGELQLNDASPWSWLLSRPDIKECVSRLAHEDLDVFSYISRLRPYFPDVEFQAMSCRGRKVAPGGNAMVALSRSSSNENSISSISSSSGGGGGVVSISNVLLENLESSTQLHSTPPEKSSSHGENQSFFSILGGDLRALSMIQAHSMHTHQGPGSSSELEKLDGAESAALFSSYNLTKLDNEQHAVTEAVETLLGVDGTERDTATSSSTITNTSVSTAKGSEIELADNTTTAGGASAQLAEPPTSDRSSIGSNEDNLQEIEDILDKMDMGPGSHVGAEGTLQFRKSD